MVNRWRPPATAAVTSPSSHCIYLALSFTLRSSHRRLTRLYIVVLYTFGPHFPATRKRPHPPKCYVVLYPYTHLKRNSNFFLSLFTLFIRYTFSRFIFLYFFYARTFINVAMHLILFLYVFFVL